MSVTERVIQNRNTQLQASVQVPGDKSLSHRALLFAAIAKGDSLVTGLGPGRDVATTVRAIEQLGVHVAGSEIRSPGIADWRGPLEHIDCGNSGTTMRLLAGVLSTSHVATTLVGDDSLSVRPMTRLVEPLERLGGSIATSAAGTAPLTVGGVSGAKGTSVAIDVASAQVRSAFELAALSAEESSTIDSPPGFRDHTERWLIAAGRGEWTSATAFTVHPGPIAPARYTIPGDPSSAAYLWALAACRPGSEVLTPMISLNSSRLGFLQILEKMGAEVEAEVTGDIGGDPVGDVVVRGRSLTAIDIGGDLVASALDELPLVAVVATFASGITRISDASELRAKESDRIESTVAMIEALGGGIEPRPDGFDVVGTGFLEGGVIDSVGDHRIAMSGTVAGLLAKGPVTILDPDSAAVSWPDFYETMEYVW